MENTTQEIKRVDPSVIAKTASNEDWMLLLDATNLIHNKLIRDFTYDFLVQRVPEYFALIPASETGKYHSQSAQGEGGLIRHTLCLVAILLDIIDLQYLQFKSNDKDLILAAAMLHDTFKHGVIDDGYQRTHPNIAAQEILKFGKERNEERLGQVIGGLVVSHMGQWGNQVPGNRGQFIVHLGDYLASRRYINVTFDALKEAIEQAKQ